MPVDGTGSITIPIQIEAPNLGVIDDLRAKLSGLTSGFGELNTVLQASNSASAALVGQLSAVGGAAGASAGQVQSLAAALQKAGVEEQTVAAGAQALRTNVESAAQAEAGLAAKAATANEALLQGATATQQHALAATSAGGAVGKAAGQMETLGTKTSKTSQEVIKLGRNLLSGTLTGGDFFTTLITQLGQSELMLNPVVLGITAAAAAIGGFVYEIGKGQAIQNDFTAAIRATGNAAGETAGGLIVNSQQIAESVHRSADEVEGLSLAIVRTGKVSGDNIGKMVEDAQLMAQAFGEKPDEALKTLEGLTGDVSQKVVELNDQVGFLTTTQYLNIRAMEENGDKAGAMGIALDALKTHMDGAKSNATGLTWVMQQLGGAIDGAIEGMRDLGRDTPEQKLARDLATKASLQGSAANFGVPTNNIDAQIDQDKKDVQAEQDDALALGGAKAFQKEEIDLLAKYSKQLNQVDVDKQDIAKTTEHLHDAELQLTNATEAGDFAAKAAAQTRLDSVRSALKIANTQLERDRKPTPSFVAGAEHQADDISVYQTQLASILALDRGNQTQQLADEIQFWNEKLAAVTGGGAREIAERNQINARLAAAQQQYDDRQQEQAQRATETAQAIARIQADSVAEIASIQSETQRRAAEDGIDAQIEGLKRQTEDGKTWSDAQIAQLKAFYAQKEQMELDEAAAERDINRQQHNRDLQTAVDNNDPVGEARANAANDQDWATYDAKRAAITAAYAKQDVAIDEDAATKRVNAYRQAANQIGNTWRGMIEGMITGSRTWAQTVQQMERGALDAVLGGIQKMVVNALVADKRRAESAKTAAKAQTDAARTAADEGGQISFKSALIAINNDAYQAASHAYTWASGFLGPIGGAAAAATTYAAVLAMEGGIAAFSARGGWDQVPFDGAVTALHKNEMVLPEKYASPLRDMLGRNAAGTTVNNRSVSRRGDDHYHIYTQPGMNPRHVADAILKGRRGNMYDARRFA